MMAGSSGEDHDWAQQSGRGDDDIDSYNDEVKKWGGIHKDLIELCQSPAERIVPVVGEIYQYPWHKGLADEDPLLWHYVTRLPEHFADIGISGHLHGATLWKQKKKRPRFPEVPLLFLQDDLEIPPAEFDFALPDKPVTAWGEVAYLRPEDHPHPPAHDTTYLDKGLPVVEAFRARLKAVRASKTLTMDQNCRWKEPDPPALTTPVASDIAVNLSDHQSANDRPSLRTPVGWAPTSVSSKPAEEPVSAYSRLIWADPVASPL
ncbi:unnamed protein product [Discula destructiva]